MRALLRFAGWATLAFVAAWLIQTPYQRVIGAIAAHAASPPGKTLEWLDLEIFFPFDLSVFAALVLSSAWVPWPARLRALGLGLAVLVGLELLTLIVVMKILLASSDQPADQAEQTQRLVIGAIRVTGLVAAGCAWLYMIGWQRLPQFADSLAVRGGGSRGGKR